jgi:hypothetical protein
MSLLSYARVRSVDVFTAFFGSVGCTCNFFEFVLTSNSSDLVARLSVGGSVWSTSTYSALSSCLTQNLEAIFWKSLSQLSDRKKLLWAVNDVPLFPDILSFRYA